jgi:hypothetical protein
MVTIIKTCPLRELRCAMRKMDADNLCKKRDAQ